MNNGVEKMEKFISNVWVRFIGAVLVVVVMILCSSFSAGKTAQATISDYAKVNFQKATNEVVAPKFEEISEKLDDITAITSQLLSDTYQDYLKEVNNCYEKLQKEDWQDLTETKLGYVSDIWAKIPDALKTDVLRIKYKALMDYYGSL